MKKLLLLFLFLTSYSTYSQDIEALKNGNFEKWTDEYQTRPYPTDWGTSLEDDPLVKSILRNDTAPHSGKHSIRLINVSGFFGDLHMGIYTGNPQTNKYIAYPYDEKMVKLKGFTRPRFIRGDSASIFLSFITNDTIKTDTIFTFSGDTINWVGFEFTIPKLDVVPDSMLMLIANANLNDLSTSSLDSYMDLDDLQFFGEDDKDLELVNGGFENWVGENFSYYFPNYWWTMNKMNLENLGVKAAPVQREEEAQEGDFAMKLITQPQAKGVAVYGNVQVLTNGSLQYSAIPYTGMPKYLKGSYKYSELENGDGNGAFLYYQFRKNGKVMDQYRIDFTADSTEEFKEFSEPLLLNEEPDSVMIVIHSGDSVGSSVVIDNLYFEGDPNRIENLNLLGKDIFEIAPNPYQSGVLKIGFISEMSTTYSFTVTDLSGKLVYENNGMKSHVGYNNVNVNLPTQIVSGFYICTIQHGQKTQKAKLLIER